MTRRSMSTYLKEITFNGNATSFSEEKSWIRWCLFLWYLALNIDTIALGREERRLI